MDRIARRSKADRMDLIREAGAMKRMAPEVVEKDFWVCWVLGRIFGSPEIARRIQVRRKHRRP